MSSVRKCVGRSYCSAVHLSSVLHPSSLCWIHILKFSCFRHPYLVFSGYKTSLGDHAHQPTDRREWATHWWTLMVEVFHNSRRNRNRKCIGLKIHYGEPRGEKKKPRTEQYKNTSMYERHVATLMLTRGLKGLLKMRQLKCCKCIHQKHDVHRWTKPIISVFFLRPRTQQSTGSEIKCWNPSSTVDIS